MCLGGVMKNAKGFSLIEILVVTVILIILSSLTVFYLSPQRRQIKSDDAARSVFNTMRQARILSISRRIYYAVVINTSEAEQTTVLNNSTLSLKFPGNSVSLVSMGLLATQNDEKIQNISIYPKDVMINPSNAVDYPIPPTSAFPNLEAGFTTAAFPSNIFVCYFDPGGRVLDRAQENGNQIYRTFYFCPQAEKKAGVNTLSTNTVQALTRALTLYGASGGVSFWRYEQNAWKTTRQ
jgi:prepilin-type N-terminal cleavage/methylation domain-containing protein